MALPKGGLVGDLMEVLLEDYGITSLAELGLAPEEALAVLEAPEIMIPLIIAGGALSVLGQTQLTNSVNDYIRESNEPIEIGSGATQAERSLANKFNRALAKKGIFRDTPARTREFGHGDLPQPTRQPPALRGEEEETQPLLSGQMEGMTENEREDFLTDLITRFERPRPTPQPKPQEPAEPEETEPLLPQTGLRPRGQRPRVPDISEFENINDQIRERQRQQEIIKQGLSDVPLDDKPKIPKPRRKRNRGINTRGDRISRKKKAAAAATAAALAGLGESLGTGVAADPTPRRLPVPIRRRPGGGGSGDRGRRMPKPIKPSSSDFSNFGNKQDSFSFSEGTTKAQHDFFKSSKKTHNNLELVRKVNANSRVAENYFNTTFNKN